jgi:AAA domain, putative AbiEii toxin, Type IV TA system/AAA domain
MHVARLEISGVRGFRGNRSVNLDFGRPDGSFSGWTVLAGRNNSGKSTILQSLALAFSGPRATSFIPAFADWMSHGATTARISATLRVAEQDVLERTLFDFIGEPLEREVHMDFLKAPVTGQSDEDDLEPEVRGSGLDSFTRGYNMSSVPSGSVGWFYAGYGPFRHLGRSGSWPSRRSSPSKLLQVSSLFDENTSLVGAVDWLIEQRLYELEDRPGASNLLRTVMALLGDGLLPDEFQVSRVTSDGLWVSHNDAEFALREMSDGYRAVTALVVDIVRQLNSSYRDLRLEYRDAVPTLPYPGVVLIDEVEAHLHISWQKAIGTWLKTHFPEIQFIVTTHSPYVCQSADPNGLIVLPGPDEDSPPRIVSEDLYERVIYGSGDDAVISDLFGVASPYSTEADNLRRLLGDLEVKVLNGSASADEITAYRALSERLTSSLAARADEVAARLGRDK